MFELMLWLLSSVLMGPSGLLENICSDNKLHSKTGQSYYYIYL